MTDQEQTITPADATIVSSGLGTKGPEERTLPATLQEDMDLCLNILRQVLSEYDENLLKTFDTVRQYAVDASAERFSGVLTDTHPERDDLEMAVKTIDAMNLHDAQLLARAFATYFHLANLCEENYRVAVLHEREAKVDDTQAIDPVNEMTKAYHQLISEMGPAKAKELLERLEFHPVFTAHPTEARRKAVEGKIRRIAQLLEAHRLLGGSDKKENSRRLYSEIDALFRTSPIALKKPTPVEEADTILDIFDNTLFHTIPMVYRRFDDWVLGDKAGIEPPACPAFFHPGSWIGSDRDGNPNVTAKVSRQVARKFSDHVLAALEEATRTVGRNMTVESETTPPSDELRALWNQQKEISERLTGKASLISTKDWVLGDEAGLVEPVCPAFFHPGSWIGSDRDGNPNVTAKVSRQVARKFSDHVLAALEEATRTVGRNMTMEGPRRRGRPCGTGVPGVLPPRKLDRLRPRW